MATIAPYKTGFCDGLLGRESNCPFSVSNFVAHADYLQGYMSGKEWRGTNNITMKIEERLDA